MIDQIGEDVSLKIFRRGYTLADGRGSQLATGIQRHMAVAKPEYLIGKLPVSIIAPQMGSHVDGER